MWWLQLGPASSVHGDSGVGLHKMVSEFLEKQDTLVVQLDRVLPLLFNRVGAGRYLIWNLVNTVSFRGQG